MADEVDIANQQAARWLQQSLEAARKSSNTLAPKGACHYCDTAFEPSEPHASRKLFCDSECAADYEREQKLKNR